MLFKYEYSMNKTLVKLFVEAVKKFPDHIIYKYRNNSKDFFSISYSDFYQKVSLFAAGLVEMKLEGKRMAIVSDNCIEWMMAVLANMGLGGVDIPRGNATPQDEFDYVIKLSDIDFVCLQNRER